MLFEKIQVSDWDKAMLKVIQDRKNHMQKSEQYKPNTKDLNLYKVSIDMLKQLPKA